MSTLIETPEVLLPSQWRDLHEHICQETPERRIAWRLLALNLSDIFVGKPRRRLRNIKEIRKWIDGVKNFDFHYPFEHWCNALDLDESWAKRKMNELLTLAEGYAITGDKPPRVQYLLDNVVSVYRNIPIW
ncbi:MAG: hypothetical protein KGJ90_03905 [Patescibacteria group bacterium]|nr:hypothetical protein [Patescibacteria group bacterium]